MSPDKFDLVVALSSLNDAIPQFRRKLKAAQKRATVFRMTRARFDAAMAKQSEMASALPAEQEARRIAEEKLDQQISVDAGLLTELAEHWKQFTESIMFIGDFLDELESVLQRLPLTPKWLPFPPAIRALRIRELGTWADVPANYDLDLDTLEIRLRDMIDLAKAGSKAYALGRNVDRLRKECGLSFDQLATGSGIGKKLILGHVNKNKGTQPSTLKMYADFFSKKLGRKVTVEDLEKCPAD